MGVYEKTDDGIVPARGRRAVVADVDVVVVVGVVEEDDEEEEEDGCWCTAEVSNSL